MLLPLPQNIDSAKDEQVKREFHAVYEQLNQSKPSCLTKLSNWFNRISVVDRETNKNIIETNPISTNLALDIGQDLSLLTNESKMIFKALTLKAGQHFDDASSITNIATFIDAYKINMEEVIPETYKSFNEFFYRKIDMKYRPLPKNDNFVAAADCRFTCFYNVDDATRYWIKGKHFTLEKLTKMSIESPKQILICRLAPCDYHRWHYPFSGQCKSTAIIPGSYYTVNPIAIKSGIDVFTENHRTVRVLETDLYGDVIEVAIGALLVGSISLNSAKQFNRGDEAGYFAYGGSTVIYIVDDNMVNIDTDLRNSSCAGVETLLKCRSSIGTVTWKPQD